MSAALGGVRSRPLVLLAVGAALGLVVLARGGAWAQSAGITVDPSALGELTEAAGAARSGAFTVVLDAAPGGDVTVALTHGGDVAVDADPGAAGNQDTLVFTTANWDTARAVAVVAVDDTVDEAASEGFSIVLSASGGGYDGVTARVAGSVADDDTAVFSVSVDKSTIAEAGAGTDAGTATLTVDITNGVSYAADRDIGLALSGSARVGEDFKLADGDGWTLPRPFILRFAPGAAQTAAVVTVVDDARDDDAETVSIAVHADGAAIGTVTVAITDDDDPPLVLSALAVSTAASREMYPAFEAGTFHYAVGCETDDPLTTGAVTVALSAQAADTRVSVNGVQAANQNGEVELDGLDGYSDVDIVLSNSTGASTTYTVHCLPKAFPDFVTTKQPGAWDGLITIKRGAGAPIFIAIIDNNGVPRFHRKVANVSRGASQFRTHPEGAYPYSYAFRHGTIRTPPGGSVYPALPNYEQVVLDDDLNEVARLRTTGLRHTDNHDFVIRENGNYIFLAYEPVVRDLTGYIKRTGDPWESTANVKDSIIQEVTPEGVVVQQSNSWDILELDDCKQGGIGYIDVEWAHVNSLQEVDGDYIAGYRRCNQVLRIDGQTGKVLWRLGLSSKSDAYWAARDGRAPLKVVGDPYGEFCGQHSARIIANGNLILYDNGGPTCSGDRRAGQFSRAVEYALDLERGEAAFVRHHSLRGELRRYARFQGVVELMDNGNWLISWGGGMDTAATEVVPGPRYSQTQGQELLTIKSLYNGATAQTRSYPLSPGALDRPPGALAEVAAVSAHNSESHLGVSDSVGVVVAFSRAVVDFDKATPSVRVTGATVASVAPHVVAGEAAHAYVFEIVPDGDGPVGFGLVAGVSCAGGGICARDGAPLSSVRSRRSVPRALVVSGLADASVAENAPYGPVAPSVAPAPAGSAGWSLEGDDAAVFAVDAVTGALSMAAKDFEAPADADGDNVYEVTVGVVDAAGRAGAVSVEVTVTDVDEAPGRPAAPAVTAVSPTRLSVRWSAPANTGPAITDYDYRYKKTSASAWTEVTGGAASTDLRAVIGSLDGATSYGVAVRAANAEGTGEWSATTAAATPSAAIAPEAVDDLAATPVSATVIDVAWSAPGDGGAAISGYRLERKTGAGGYSAVSPGVAAGAESYRDSGRGVGTAYTYRIRAVNSVGAGGWSNEAAATTPLPAVTDLAATAVAVSVIELTWSAPDTGGAAISGYQLERRTGAGGYGVVSSGIAAGAESHRDSSLSAGTTYTYRIRAVGSASSGIWSNEPSATTPFVVAAPRAVDDLAAIAQSDSVVELTWSAPDDGGAAISGYRLERRTGAGGYGVVSSGIAAGAESYRDGGLDAGTAYTYRIRAVNRVGSGVWSNEPAAATAASVPEAVDDLAAIAQSDSVVELTWSAPDDGGAAISGYRLERRTGAGGYGVVSSGIAAGATSYRDGGLGAATAYTYRIRAVNRVGSGVWSNEPAAATAASVPEAVDDLAAIAQSDSVVELTWSAPDDGGAAISGYRLERRTGAGGYGVVSSGIAAGAESYRDGGLGAGTAYTYRIRAVNRVGSGVWSNEPAAATAASVPEAVDDLAAIAQSDSVVELTWSAPDDGGAAISGYRLERRTGAGGYGVVSSGIAAGAESYRDGGLGAATAYTYRIRAVNRVGSGAWSNEPSATTPFVVAAPRAVDDLAAAAQSDSVVELTWTAPDVVGPAISGYELERRTGAGAYSVVSSGIAAGATSYRDGGLSAGTAYTYRIRAVNSVGSGVWSNEPSATTSAAAVVNGAPVFASASATRSVAENSAPASAVGARVAATDGDGDTLAYALAASGDHAHFDIDSATGQLRTSGALDYESKISYAVTVTVSDGSGGTDTIAVTVTVTDVNEAPVFAGASASATAAENQTAVAGSPTAADPDAGDTVTYGIDASSGDGASFDVDAGSGVLSFKAAPDYEAKRSYAVTVRARDSRDADGNPDTAWDASIAVTVTVTDVNEPPPQPTPSATAPQRGAEPEPATGGAADDRTEFTDIGGSAHRDNIESIAQAKITLGCNPPANDRFCPRRAVTRAQMASFLARALRLPAAARDRFTDTTGSVHRDSINRIAQARITLGCNPPANDRFCPQRAVTRAQMASFLARALRLPAARDYFTDTTGSVHRDSINRIARAKITLGCNPPANDRFCPQRAVTRAQMASFLARALTLPDSAP